MSSPGSDEGRELGTRYRLPIRSDDMGRIRRVVVNRMTFTKPDSRYTDALKQVESKFDYKEGVKNYLPEDGHFKWNFMP
jgi:hypothetical protein